MSLATRSLAGIALLATAVGAPIARLAYVQWIDWTPVEVPLAAAVPWRREFRVDQSGKYELAVKIDRPGDRAASTAAECALGFDFVDCEPFVPLALRWRLAAADGGPVTCGGDDARAGTVDSQSSAGGFTTVSIERWLGCFDADEDARYVIDVEPLAFADFLKPLNPRFVVQPSSALNRDEYSLTAAVWMISLLVGLAGGLAIVLGRPQSERRSRRRSRTESTEIGGAQRGAG